MKVFVYGTLLRGLSRHSALGTAVFRGHGIVGGMLTDLGDYPVLARGDGIVYGEVFEVDGSTLQSLDAIEGYRPGDGKGSLFLRQEMEVTLMHDGSRIRAEAYFFNGDPERGRVIECGEYRRYLAESTSPDQWYIAFASNMSTERLERRIGIPHAIEKGYLEGYRLMFNKKADGGGVYANIAWAGAGYRCPFTACVLDRDLLRLLDGFEGGPSHYARIVVPFSVMSGGPQRMGHLYMANPEKLTSRGTPSAAYLKFIHDGYKEHGFDTKGLPKP